MSLRGHSSIEVEVLHGPKLGDGAKLPAIPKVSRRGCGTREMVNHLLGGRAVLAT
jgi:hypothetical protein